MSVKFIVEQEKYGAWYGQEGDMRKSKHNDKLYWEKPKFITNTELKNLSAKEFILLLKGENNEK